MKQPVNREANPYSGWLLFIYKVPSKPVNKRMKIWRKLIKAGAIQFKGAAYLLPHNEDHYEFLDGLVSEVSSLGGEAALIKADHVENIEDNDLITLFNHQRKNDYKVPEKSLQNLKVKVYSMQMGSMLHNVGQLKSKFNCCLKEYEEIKKRDFFSSEVGNALYSEIRMLQKRLDEITRDNTDHAPHAITPRKINDYKGRTWVTHPGPFVDRMATAWLIKRFIDSEAQFEFAGEEDLDRLQKNMVSYDVRNGEVTHVGDMCTFEVLLSTFDLKEKRLKKIAKIVHDLDIKDGKYTPAEAKGLENILLGIRKSTQNDKEALEKGINIFEMLYTALA